MTLSVRIRATEFLARLLARRLIPALRRMGCGAEFSAPRMAVVPDDHIGKSIIAEGLYERDDIALLRQIVQRIRSPGVLIDVGANIGNHSIALSDLFARVISYEPHPVTGLILQANIALSGRNNIVARLKALGETEGTVVLEDVDRENCGSARVSSADSATGHRVAVGTGDNDLAEVLDNNDRIDLLKMDAEGFEPPVIRGMAGLLRSHQPIVVFESADAAAFERIRAELSALGYSRLYSMNSSASPRRWLRFLSRATGGYRSALAPIDAAPDDFASMIVAVPSRFEESMAATR